MLATTCCLEHVGDTSSWWQRPGFASISTNVQCPCFVIAGCTLRWGIDLVPSGQRAGNELERPQLLAAGSGWPGTEHVYGAGLPQLLAMAANRCEDAVSPWR